MYKINRVAFVGSIAVGKSTIIRNLQSLVSNCSFVLEEPMNNLFLQDFYSDMKKWGFHCQISSLAMVTENYLLCPNERDGIIIFDRCVDEIINFASLQYEFGNMNHKEFKLFKSLYNSILSLSPPIDLFIYCKCDAEISFERIKKRNRTMEQRINIGYIKRLNDNYERWINSIEEDKLLVIDTTSDIDVNTVCKKIINRVKLL